GRQEEVPSPTFTLVQTYEMPELTIWHFDGFRLRDPEEGWELGIEDAFRDGVSLVEWPERFGPLIPTRRPQITFEHVGSPGAAAPGGCRALCHGRRHPARARLQRPRDLCRGPRQRLSADRGFRRRHLYKAARERGR